jgi:aspartyl-tRNA(Asn)/glutamyl-tRNA(Gln) amidotransferase subunit A
MLENFVPPYDATVVERIKRADGIVLGKTNMDEFCMGSSTENSAFYPTLNPVNYEYVPGGTSGGSAAAVAAGFAPLALGSDTGGSVRQPAAFCGVVGMKPTYGRSSRYGLIAYASSFDQIGAIAHTVEDVALLLSVITGYDPRDSTSAELSPIASRTGSVIRPLTIGISTLPKDGVDGEVAHAITTTLDRLVEAGHRQVAVELLDPNVLLACYYVIASAEASANLARYDGTRFGPAFPARTYEQMVRRVRSAAFGEEVKRRIMLGTFVLSAGYYDDYYGRAVAVRAQLVRQLQAAFARCDIIIQPIAPSVAFKLGQKTADPMQMYLADLYSVTANVAGVPAISVPCGTGASGLPLAVQLLAPWNEDDRLLAAAREVERLSAPNNERARP